MCFFLTSHKSNKTGSKRKQSDRDRKDLVQERSEGDSHQAPGGFKVASIAWAIAVYLIEREKQRTQVELARWGLEAKKQDTSHS